MTTDILLEKRLAAVEAAIAQLQKQVSTDQPANWLQQITGSFEDELAFEEALNVRQSYSTGRRVTS
ncbi:hypothetical protein [cf. Phormidesmis sp. LEGE 11477]|uniref:hypothetical protein n=1 Tax=cf. Phormidesmis sp. LEGE 11477 TaxID=1828680 RepID=UPI001D13D8EA|nr:hypothetical protein [cf. Phormidesmis sp. LEGE 11477]